MSRSQDSKQKYPLSGNKSSTKTARVKATVTPRTLTADIDGHGGEGDVKLASQAVVALPKPAQRPQHLSPLLSLKTEAETGPCLPQHQDLGALPVGFPVTSAVAVSPYMLEPVESEMEPDDGKDVDVDVDGCSPGADGRSSPLAEECSFAAEQDPEASDEEDRDESATGAASTTLSPDCAIPTTVTDTDEDILEPTASSEDSCVSEQLVDSSACLSTRVPPVVQNLPQPSPADSGHLGNKSETFKQPLPRKSSVCGKKSVKKTSPSGAGYTTRSDVDLHWYRNALRQAVSIILPIPLICGGNPP